MSTPSHIHDRIARVAAQALGANLTASDLEGVTRLDEVLAFESLTVLEFVAGLEAEFAVEIELERFWRDYIMNLPALVEYLEQQAKPK